VLFGVTAPDNDTRIVLCKLLPAREGLSTIREVAEGMDGMEDEFGRSPTNARGNAGEVFAAFRSSRRTWRPAAPISALSSPRNKSVEISR
jgi:hypothetical protein